MGDPAVFMVLGPAELPGDRELDGDLLGLAEVIACDLVAGVGHRLPVFVPEGEIDARQSGLFPELALRAGELRFARFDEALRKVPVVVRAEDEVVDAAPGAAEDDHARGARRHLGFHARNATTGAVT